jgi:transposase
LRFEPDELRDFGFSKDCKFKETQVVLALVTTSEGLPITYQTFAGKTTEGTTLVQMVQRLKSEYEINNVMLVADRAMFVKQNLNEMDRLGVKYIVAAKLKTLPGALKKQLLAPDYRAALVADELHWLKEFEHETRRLVVGYSSTRARKDQAERMRLVERLEKKVKLNRIKIADLIPNAGTKRFLRLQGGEAMVDDDKIAADAEWDGLHGIITNVRDERPEKLLSRYRDLWNIEAAFRLSKHDLRMRPMFHWTPKRIKAHIAICFIALALAKQATFRVARQFEPMSFERLRNELLHAQASIIFDVFSKKRYLLPSSVSVVQKRIYQVFGLKRTEIPQVLK